MRSRVIHALRATVRTEERMSADGERPAESDDGLRPDGGEAAAPSLWEQMWPLTTFLFVLAVASVLRWLLGAVRHS